MYPASKAQATLEELDRFIAAISEVDQWVFCDKETGEEVWTSTNGGCFTWMLGPYDKVGMDGGKVFFEHAGRPRVETAHFRQRPFGRPGTNGDQHMTITCLDTGAEAMTFDSLGPEGSPKVERTFCVTSKKAPFLYEGKYWMAERLRNLLVASIETGNPIQWC
jgi:hypothetical protein